MRRTVLTAVLGTTLTLAVPAVANAWSIHNYRVRDAGPTIVHKLTLCSQVKPGYEQRFYVTAHSETGDGSDPGSVQRSYWVSRGCWNLTVEHNDDLEYRGVYYGRVKVRLAQTDWIKNSSWRRFYSS